MDITKYALNLSPLLMQQVATGAVTVKYVTSFPEEKDRAENTVYLMPDGNGGHFEYIWNGKEWVLFGSTNGQGRLDMHQDGEYLVIDQAPGLPRDADTGAPPIVETVSGETIAVNGSAERPMKDLKIFGKTTQTEFSEEVITIGRNLLPTPYADGDKAISGITFTNADGKLYFYGQSIGITNYHVGSIELEADTYTLTRSEHYTYFDSSQFFWDVRDANGNSLMGEPDGVGETGKDWLSFSFTLTEKTEVLIYIVIQGGTFVEGYFQIQLEKGESATEWEAYTETTKTVTRTKFSNVGGSGSIGITVTDGADKSQTLTVLTPGGLCGLDISNYRDYVDFGSGKLVRWFDTFTFYGTEDWEASKTSFDRFVAFNIKPSDLNRGVYTPIVSNYFTYGNREAYTEGEQSLITGNKVITVKILKSELDVETSTTNSSALSAWKDRLKKWAKKGAPLYVISERVEPIETPLPANEIEAFKALRFHYLNTSITNDSGAHMEVEYVADTKNYIDKNSGNSGGEVETLDIVQTTGNSKVSVMSQKAVTEALDGYEYINADFVIGRFLGTTGVISYQKSTYAICSNNVLRYDRDITLTVADGYEVALWSVDDDNLPIKDITETPNTTNFLEATSMATDGITGTGLIIPAKTNFLMRIQAAPLDKTVKADIELYKKQVTIIPAMQKEINGLKHRISAIENADALPDYYVDYMEEKITEINNKDCLIGSHGDSFIFITDTHTPRNKMNSPSLIKEIVNNTSVRFVINGGDTLDNHDTKDKALSLLREWRNLMHGVTEYRVMGNHDLNKSGNANEDAFLSTDDWYGTMVKPLEDIVNTDGKYYFCVDNESQKIRYICLASMYGSSSLEIRTWLKEKLTELESGWTVLVIPHYLWNGSDTDTIHANGQCLINDINEVYSSMSATLIGVLAGHSHADYSTTDTKNGYLLIATTCDACTGTPAKKEGTVTEQAFDVIHIDTANRKLYATRIGAGVNREWVY